MTQVHIFLKRNLPPMCAAFLRRAEDDLLCGGSVLDAHVV